MYCPSNFNNGNIDFNIGKNVLDVQVRVEMWDQNCYDNMAGSKILPCSPVVKVKKCILSFYIKDHVRSECMLGSV